MGALALVAVLAGVVCVGFVRWRVEEGKEKEEREILERQGAAEASAAAVMREHEKERKIRSGEMTREEASLEEISKDLRELIQKKNPVTQ